MARPPSLESGYDSFNSPHLPGVTPATRIHPQGQTFVNFSPVTPLEANGPTGGYRQEWAGPGHEIVAGDIPEHETQVPEGCSQVCFIFIFPIIYIVSIRMSVLEKKYCSLQ